MIFNQPFKLSKFVRISQSAPKHAVKEQNHVQTPAYMVALEMKVFLDF